MTNKLAQRKLHRRSVVDTAGGQFFAYEADGHVVYVDDDGNLFFDTEGKQPVADEHITTLVTQQMLQDSRVFDARIKLSEQHSGGSGLLARALRWHLDYNGGEIHPLNKDGINFYQVGRNASHQFFVGYNDGKQFVLSVCCDWDEEQQDTVIEERVREVDSWDGCYLGHL